MNAMKFIHTAWTKPMFIRWDITDTQLTGNLWLYALSVHYAKKTGVKIDLHTDTYGKHVFGVLPYDNIHLTLDELTINPSIWAAGKFLALQKEPLGTIHIDGDVFVKTQMCLETVNPTGYDIVVQSKEYSDETNPFLGYFYNDILDILVNITDKRPIPICIKHRNRAYNTGVIGFNNQHLKDEFIRQYLDIAKFLSANKKYLSVSNSESIPDLIIEQMHIAALCIEKNSRVKFVFPDLNNMQERAKEIGYTHVIGKEKYNRIGEVQNRLQQENPELFKRVLNHIKTL